MAAVPTLDAQESAEHARSADLIARSASIPMGKVVPLIMDSEVPQPVDAIKVRKDGKDHWKVIGPTGGSWLHPHHKLGFGDQTHAADLPIYTFAESTLSPVAVVPEPSNNGEAEIAEGIDNGLQPDYVFLAMGLSFISFMRRQGSSTRVHFGDLINDFMTFIFVTANHVRALKIQEALQSAFTDLSTCSTTVISSITGKKGHIVLESAARFDVPPSQAMYPSAFDDPRSWILLNFMLSQLPGLNMVKFYFAIAFFDCHSRRFQGYGVEGARGTTNFVLENTFRYLHNTTLVVVLAILIPELTECPNLPFQGNKLILVAEKLPDGSWKPFLVGGLSLMPVIEEEERHLPPSQQLPPLADSEAAGVHQAAMTLLQGTLTDKEVVHFPCGRGSSSCIFASNSKVGRRPASKVSGASTTVKGSSDGGGGKSKRSYDSKAAQSNSNALSKKQKTKKNNKQVEKEV